MRVTIVEVFYLAAALGGGVLGFFAFGPEQGLLGFIGGFTGIVLGLLAFSRAARPRHLVYPRCARGGGPEHEWKVERFSRHQEDLACSCGARYLLVSEAKREVLFLKEQDGRTRAFMARSGRDAEWTVAAEDDLGPERT